MEAVRQYIRERVVLEDRGYKSPCWIWQREIDYKGYGRGTQAELGKFKSHRGSHIAFIGPIPDGHDVDHLCTVRCCVNPDHLEAVTPAENRRRQSLRSGHTIRGGTYRRSDKCHNGHEYVEGSFELTAKGRRRCLRCPPRTARNKTPRTKCVRGHAFTDGNQPVMLYGRRRCPMCLKKEREHHAQYLREKRAAARKLRRGRSFGEQRLVTHNYSGSKRAARGGL